jgi:hypothetical protein
MKPKTISKDEFLHLLARLKQAIDTDDSMEGNLSYEWAKERHFFDVQAFIRVGNSEGQGGAIIVGEATLPSPIPTLEEVEQLRARFDAAVASLRDAVLSKFKEKDATIFRLSRSIDYSGGDYHDRYIRLVLFEGGVLSLEDTGENPTPVEDVDSETLFNVFSQVLRDEGKFKKSNDAPTS